MCLVLASCAGVQTEREAPAVSAQQTEEAGKLPVGRIVTGERVDVQRSRPLNPGGVAGAIGAAGPIALPVLALANAVRNADWFYRYSIQMKRGGEQVLESQYEFKVGDCIAFRSGLQEQSVAAIRALPGECD